MCLKAKLRCLLFGKATWSTASSGAVNELIITLSFSTHILPKKAFRIMKLFDSLMSEPETSTPKQPWKNHQVFRVTQRWFHHGEWPPSWVYQNLPRGPGGFQLEAKNMWVFQVDPMKCLGNCCWTVSGCTMVKHYPKNRCSLSSNGAGFYWMH